MKHLNILLLSLLMLPTTAKAENISADSLASYIRDAMPLSVRECPADTLDLFGLPKPYSVPCIRGHFQDMYYWDTYFTNIGLLLIGDTVQARNNIENILAMIERFGFMPNGSNKAFLGRSQPPYASMMVRDIYEATGDRSFLAHADSVLKREYDFWMTRRIAPNGLNRYGHQAGDDELNDFFEIIYARLQRNPEDVKEPAERIALGAHLMAEAESGWDFTPRFDGRCMDFNPVDLNSNLYVYEKNFTWFADQLGLPDSDKWLDRAEHRRQLMTALMVDPETGLYHDYDFINTRRSDINSAAAFSPLYAGLATGAQAHAAVRRGLPLIEMPHGIAACEDRPHETVYQWDYPNCWAALNIITIKGLANYGFDSDVLRVAKKYRDATLNIFNATSNLWEKYNASTGDIDARNEYGLPGAFLGWTAAAYLLTHSLLTAQPTQ